MLSSALGKYPRQFLSTPSARRATSPGSITTAGESNFYPRPPRGGRHPKLVPNKRIKSISIHALREEGDPELQCCCTNRRIFLSTPSARRATPSLTSCPSKSKNFYPRPPRGGRPPQRQQLTERGRFLSTPSARRATDHNITGSIMTLISIHALREEGDLGNTAALSVTTIFLSTPSARRAT